MGILDTKAAKVWLDKQTHSWEGVIKQAKHFRYTPTQVYKMIGKKFDEDFYQGTHISTFMLCSLYRDRLSKLKKGEKPYSAQTWILRYYPTLIDFDTFKLATQKRKAKEGSHQLKTINDKLRSKRNIILNKYKRLLTHPNFDMYYKVFYPSAIMQKILKSFYIR